MVPCEYAQEKTREEKFLKEERTVIIKTKNINGKKIITQKALLELKKPYEPTEDTNLSLICNLTNCSTKVSVDWKGFILLCISANFVLQQKQRDTVTKDACNIRSC